MSETAAPVKGAKARRELQRAVIRFAGDSGDGMQLTGEQFTTESAWAGNDIATLPNFPAEIRAPAGTLFGVSSFQLQFGSQRVYTPGDRLDCLVAMNPAALKVHLRDLKPGGLLVVNTAAFDKRNLDKAGYAANPLEDSTLAERYRLHKVDMTALTYEAIKDLPLGAKEKDRTKNFFALGLVSWIYTRPLEPTLDWIGKKFTKSPQFAEANTRVLKAGHAFGETAEFFEEAYTIEPAEMAPGLYRAMTGNRASPVVVLAPATPGDCFYVAYEAVRIAVKYMVPVIVLSDGFLANGSEPWLIPDPNTLPPIDIQFRTEKEGFFPYLRDPATLARPWVRPGTPGLEHRIGGIEKQDVTGNISYDPENHDHMVRTRAEKVRRVAQEIPPTSINGPATGDVLVVGWGGTYGAITAAVERAQGEGKSVAAIHLRHLNPLPPDLGHILREYRRVLVPEINSGQLVRVLRAEYLVDAVGFNRMRALPLPSDDIYEAIIQLGSQK